MCNVRKAIACLDCLKQEKPTRLLYAGFVKKPIWLAGRHIHIDDLITIPQSRRCGYASRLLDKVHQIAAEQGITQIHVDCHVGSERTICSSRLFSTRL